MGLLGSMIGNASQITVDEIIKKYGELFYDGENVECAYSLVRDKFIFTNKRLLLIDHQGVTGKKVEYLSLPYNKITQFAVETAGHLDLDAELKIWMPGLATPIKKQFSKSTNIYEIQSVLAKHVLG